MFRMLWQSQFIHLKRANVIRKRLWFLFVLFCYECISVAVCNCGNGLSIKIIQQVHMNICEHLIIKTVICHSTSKLCFDSCRDTETFFWRSRNQSYAAVNLKQLVFPKSVFWLSVFCLKLHKL